MKNRQAAINMFADYFKEKAKRAPHKFTEMEIDQWKKDSIAGG